MKTVVKILLLSLLFPVFFFSCDNNPSEPEPCELYTTGIYNNVMPGEVPEKFWPCMNTKGLVDAGSYNFNSLYQLDAGCCGLQSGYDLCKSNYSWYADLEGRDDAFQYLLAKYISIDTVNYDLNLYYWERGYKFYAYNLEVFLAQKAYLEDATVDQKITLINELFKKQGVRDAGYGDDIYEGPAFVMSRIMYYDGYGPLLDDMEQNILIKNLVELGHLRVYLHEEGLEAQLRVFSLANDYLNELKTK